MLRARQSLPPLPSLLQQKLTKTGYTRGATVREIYQNRVTRNNTVLIDWRYWKDCSPPPEESVYENGFIGLVAPSWYFQNPEKSDSDLAAVGLEIGRNALLLFTKRTDWDRFVPPKGRLPNGKPFGVATSRVEPLGGTYFARVAATVADGGGEIISGFNTTSLRGAGIRVYEYASQATIKSARTQLECLAWMCSDSEPAMKQAGMTTADIQQRRGSVMATAEAEGLLDTSRLKASWVVNSRSQTICPLCKEEISALDLMKRSAQAVGREVHDLTITEISLFHIQELRMGTFQHKPYNLGWGHHHCNVVVKDAGIKLTLEWMEQVLKNQD